MAKNEIHARISPQLMEEVKRWTDNWKFSTISHTIRRLLELGLKVANDELDLQKNNDSLVQLIEQELEVFFARCRDKYDPEDGQLYWFWFEAKEKSSWRFDPDSPNNWCPTKRFKSREDAIRDCLREKMANSANVNALTESLLPSLKSTNESNEDNIIDW